MSRGGWRTALVFTRTRDGGGWSARRLRCLERLEPRLALHAESGETPLAALYDPASRSETLFGAGVGDIAEETAAAKVPLSELPQLSSLPGAPATLFLDFDGSTSDNLPPFTRDSDRTTYSDAELSEIREIFARVSEFFSPFKLNVTTVDPKSYQAFKTSRIVMSDDNDGAWAYVGSFRSGGGGFGRVGNDGWGNANDMAMVIAHEAGHTFGLEHQSTFDDTGRETQEYNPGNSVVGPIMGAPYGSQRQLWWDGPTYSANPSTYQDDLAVLASTDNRFGYRADDVPNSISQARELDPLDSSYAFAGVITRTTDRDAFRFTVAEASRATLRGDVADNGSAMLNLKLQVYDSEGELLMTRDTSGMGEVATLTLDPGDYRVVVASHGDYGDVGQYRLQVNLLPVAWQRTLVGGGSSTASASYLDQSLRVDGAGRDIGGAADGFQFVHQPLTGDGGIAAQLERLNEDHEALRAGVMIRSSTSASAPFVAVLYSPGEGLRMQWRDAAGQTADAGEAVALDAPTWVRLSRRGDEFIGEYSLDGDLWTELGRHSATLDPSARIGLAVAARGSADARVFFGGLTLRLGATAGDIDGDGAVDLIDFGILKTHFGSAGVSRTEGDLTGDGRVNLDDFGVLKTNFSSVVLAELLAQQQLPTPEAEPSPARSPLAQDPLNAAAALGLAFAAWDADEADLS